MKAYSYIRFSSLKQRKGGSLERQTELSEAYCKKHGLTLDNTLHLQDLGISAFRGSNVKEGALAGFLEACRNGKVARGSVLIVESLDRLSRDQISPALKLFLDIQDFGITIVTLQPEREYKPESTQALDMIEPLIIFSRGHEESAMKSYRTTSNWKRARDRARQTGQPITKACPAWLETTPTGFIVKPGPAAVVKQIFAWCLEGMGAHRIAARLQATTPPLRQGHNWTRTFVDRILHNPAVIGILQPRRLEGTRAVADGEPIPNYYPAVIDEATWRKAQLLLRRRSEGRGAGRVGKESNLFAKLLVEKSTKRPMRIYTTFGKKKPGRPRTRYLYLAPTTPSGALIRKHSVPYSFFEEQVLKFIQTILPANLQPDNDTDKERQAKIASLTTELAEIDDWLATTNEHARRAKNPAVFLDLIEAKHGDREKVVRQLEQLYEQQPPQAAVLDDMQAMFDQFFDVRDPDQDEAYRRRLKQQMRSVIRSIDATIHKTGRKLQSVAITLHLHSGRAIPFVFSPEAPTAAQLKKLAA